MAINDKNTIIRLTAAKKITAICLIMACFILAIASSNNLQVADAHKSSDKPDVEFIRQFGTSDVDSAEDVFADSSGVYVVGFTDNTLPGQTSEGDEDAFLAKLSIDDDDKKHDDDRKKDHDDDAKKKG